MGANLARTILGPKRVAQLEDVVYGVADSYNQWRYKDAPPPSYWSESPASSAPVAASSPIAPQASAAPDASRPDAAVVPAAPTFPPRDFSAPIVAVAGPADGRWLALADDVAPNEPAVMAKTLVHPDASRPYAQVAIVAMDLSRVRIALVPGTEEPASTAVRRAERPGKIPDQEHGNLIAAFNGGWQAIHGAFGMMVDGRELLPPKDTSCTVVLNKDRSMRIAPWPDVASERDGMQAFRQTPPCLVAGGVEHRGLSEGSRNWGAAVDGATVIRRSGVGLDRERNILYYASGDSLSVLTLARAMTAAGATDVAELDVNWSFPRFLFYTHAESDVPRVKESLIPCSFRKNEHTGVAYYRDYFYVVRDTATR